MISLEVTLNTILKHFLYLVTDRSSSEPVEDTDTTSFLAEFVSSFICLSSTHVVYLTHCLDMSSMQFALHRFRIVLPQKGVLQ